MFISFLALGTLKRLPEGKSSKFLYSGWEGSFIIFLSFTEVILFDSTRMLLWPSYNLCGHVHYSVKFVSPLGTQATVPHNHIKRQDAFNLLSIPGEDVKRTLKK